MTKTNPTTDGLVERLRASAQSQAREDGYPLEQHAAWEAASRIEALTDAERFAAQGYRSAKEALTASELLVTKLQNQLDGRGNSAVAESAPFRLAELVAGQRGEWRDLESGVTVNLTAVHLDATMGEGWHQHTFAVTIWREGEPWTDSRAALAALDSHLKAIAPLTADGHRELPPELWSNEAIARSVSVLCDVVEVYVTRLDEPRFSARLRR